MTLADTVKLVSKSYTQDALGQQIASETLTEIYAVVRSVTQSEWFNAGKIGMKPSFVVVTPFMNYDGQEELIWRNRRYSVYRSFLRETDDAVELYCEEKTGS